MVSPSLSSRTPMVYLEVCCVATYDAHITVPLVDTFPLFFANSAIASHDEASLKVVSGIVAVATSKIAPPVKGERSEFTKGISFNTPLFEMPGALDKVLH